MENRFSYQEEFVYDGGIISPPLKQGVAVSEAQTGNPDFSPEPSRLDSASIRRKRIIAVLALLALPLLLAGAFFTWYQFSRGVLVYAVVQVRLEDDEEGLREVISQKRAAKIKSLEVLSHALSQPHVARLDVVKRQTNAVQWLNNELNVNVGDSLDTVRLSIRGSNSAELVVVLDAVVEAFVKAIGSDDPESLAQKAKEAKEKSEQMLAKMPPQMREQLKRKMKSRIALEETPRARILQKATVWK